VDVVATSTVEKATELPFVELYTDLEDHMKSITSQLAPFKTRLSMTWRVVWFVVGLLLILGGAVSVLACFFWATGALGDTSFFSELGAIVSIFPGLAVFAVGANIVEYAMDPD
jgi:hypothetical protein